MKPNTKHLLLLSVLPIFDFIINHQYDNFTMKISALSLLLTFSATSAFAPQLASTQHSASSSQLNLFGGGAKKDGEKKGPGMMDQLAMLKKAQEMASKKNKLDQELAAMDFEGSASDGKVKVMFKYVPSKNPMDPTPEYDAIKIEFDDTWYEGASTDDLSAAVKEAISDGMEAVNKGVEAKYEVLKGDLAATFGAMGGEAPALGGEAPPS
jgi:DNA-binding protein YbaB